jgi:DNA-binding FadR family transcriptional regulator
MATGAIAFRPPERRRIHEHVAEQLRDAIFDGRFQAGDKLPPERELAEEFRVNRTSIRDAIKVLEGFGLVRVRHGDGITVRPLTDASFDALPAMIFHRDRIDVALLSELIEVMSPLLVEMGRLAIDRHLPAQLEVLRRLRDEITDQGRDREERMGAVRDVLVALSDMTGNRVWQMLARSTRRFLEARPLVEARARYARDPAQIVPSIDACLAAIESGSRADAVRELERVVRLVYETILRDVQSVQGGGAAR